VVEKIKAKSFLSRALLGVALGGAALAADACGGHDRPPGGGDIPPGGGDTCGGFIGQVCPLGKYCDYEAGDCGYGDAVGTCRPIPGACTQECTKVCGCDGLTYCNACMAHRAGLDESADMTCTGTPPPPPTTH
jgi:hypothetical protein